ncbi:GerAB/ArcD/ProY family transporter [Cohnella boryungensis]|uniref:GerAB/ArcD/ProY family transporter n=1 Tax=Cohnella boryungensis TaxID=768479 RepID=A0ABV8S6V6_9BACL
MKAHNTVDGIQIAGLMIAYTTGSSIVFIPNPISEAAGNVSWLSTLLSFSFGLIVLFCTLYLYRVHQGQDLITYSRMLLGRFVSCLVAITVAGLLLFALPAVVAGIGDFLSNVMMTETPVYVFNSLSFFTIALTARAGLKDMARAFVLLVFIMLVIALLILLLALPLYKPAFFLPFLPDGIRPVLHGTFLSSGFPFGEIFLFAMIYPFFRPDKRSFSTKPMYIAYCISGTLLFLCVLCTSLTFGPATGYYKYSLYSLASEIHVAELLQRIEAIVGIALIIGSYMKASIFLFMLNQVVIKLLKIKDEAALIYPITLVSLFLSLTLFKDPSDFNDQIYVLWPFAIIFVGCSLIVLLAIISWFRIRLRTPAQGRDKA